MTILREGTDVAADLRPAIVVLAVKPQMMNDAIRHYGRFAQSGAVFLSIAAGKTLGYFARHLGADAAIVRAMPNTPAAIGRGITVACPNARAGAAQIALCDRLLAAVGEVGWVDDERLIDAVTGVSGSGPAYVFLLIECLAKAGVSAGLLGRARHAARPGNGLRRRRAGAAFGRAGCRTAPERHEPGGHDACRAQRADGVGRARALDDQGGRRGHRALARAGGVAHHV